MVNVLVFCFIVPGVDLGAVDSEHTDLRLEQEVKVVTRLALDKAKKFKLSREFIIGVIRDSISHFSFYLACIVDIA